MVIGKQPFWDLLMAVSLTAFGVFVASHIRRFGQPD